MERESGSIATKAALYLAVPLAVAVAAYLVFQSLFLSPADPASTQVVLYEVAPESTLKTISKGLEERGIIKNWWTVTYLARMRSKDTKITAGEYELSPAMSPVQVLAKIAGGKPFERRVTLREGVSIWELGALLEEAGILTKAEFNPALTDRDLLQAAGIPSDSFEGYLFPNTYNFSRPVTAKKIIWKMMEEGENNWPQAFSDRADELKLSRHQVLTLASIIEKESGNAEEQGMVSSVFHNRMSRNMKLQSDPTVIYGIPEFNGNLTRADLERPSPYNTYVNAGLPPGPICNPGKKAIEATLFPQETAYLYFVGDGKGSHVFSVTLAEHNAAVAKYQLKQGN